MDINNWLKENTESLKGKTVAITGATGDLGKAICKHLAFLGADLIFLDRNRIKSEKAGKDLLRIFPQTSIKYITVDLSDFDSVKKTNETLDKTDVDILILNSGVYNVPRAKCATGFDNIFQVNFVSQYYLSYRISLKTNKKNLKIVAVSSIAHFLANIKSNDIERLNCKNREIIYGNSKKILTYALFDLAERMPEVDLCITHPGITYTNMMTNYSQWFSRLIKYPMKKIFMSPSKASLSVIKGIFTKSGPNKWVGPKYLSVWGLPKISEIKKLSKSEYKSIKEITYKIENL